MMSRASASSICRTATFAVNCSLLRLASGARLRESTGFGNVFFDAGEGLRVTRLGVVQDSVQQALNGLLGAGPGSGGIGRVCHEEPELQQGGEEDVGVVFDETVSDATCVCLSL